jgi:hypothetical protein
MNRVANMMHTGLAQEQTLQERQADDRREEEFMKMEQHDQNNFTMACHTVRQFDLGGPRVVRESVRHLLQKWGTNIKPISPQDFLYNLLRSRGYPAQLLTTSELKEQV